MDMKKICTIDLRDFTPKYIGEYPFYERIDEVRNVFSRFVSDWDFDKCFARPKLVGNFLEWFVVNADDTSVAFKLSDSGTEFKKYNDQYKAIKQAIADAISSAPDSQKEFLAPLIQNGEDAMTYVVNGHVLFGVWGVSKRSDRPLETLIIDSGDHPIYTIKYTVKGQGKVERESYQREYGWTISDESDVPKVTPAQGFYFARWEPSMPQGKTVTSDMEFVAVCEPVDEEPDSAEQKPIPPDIEENDEAVYSVRFVSDDGGEILGRSEYSKKHGETVSESEVPEVQPQDGYEFVGWDKDPNNHTVTQDVDFVAQYRKIPYDVRFNGGENGRIEGQNHYTKYYGDSVDENEIPNVEPNEGFEFAGWDRDPASETITGDTEFVARYNAVKLPWWKRMRGCLNWLLLLLLLALIGLLLWYLFGRHYMNFCGCDCEQQVVVIPSNNDNNNQLPGNTQPQVRPCNAQVKSGGDEGYVGVFDMGQQSGSFVFQYNTQVVPDSIVIHDGSSVKDKVVFNYSGSTYNSAPTAVVNFTKGKVTVEVMSLGDGTWWEFLVNCPQN